MQGKIEIRQILFQTAEYRKELDLRDRALRKPLGLSLFDENLAGEAVDTHIGAFCGGKLIGALVLSEVDHETVKMRQVVVGGDRRGIGVGAAMVVYAEDLAKKTGRVKIVLHARRTVVGFYEKLGYERAGEEFIEVSLPHQKMIKRIV